MAFVRKTESRYVMNMSARAIAGADFTLRPKVLTEMSIAHFNHPLIQEYIDTGEIVVLNNSIDATKAE